ncbi:TetR/AcrR family transcriptional regulator [Oxalobacteraceae bacterium CAVE-383]|nr:TetR/AcrR family transcriptional regulator [Oxalobacteraceae bacterium CAVE-383]
MPRVSRVQTDKNRAAIETVAARLFQEQGINGVSVAELMGAAGLTHGGFYGHFDSKESLAAIACLKAFELSAARRAEKIARNGNDAAAALAEITDVYLRPEHRDDPGGGCPALALAADIAREAPGKPVRAAYLDSLKQMLATFTELSSATSAGDPEQAARMRLALLVGTLTLARATAGDPLSDAFLDAGRTLAQRID